eukprot:7384954-Prymnesium_polylepis.1
MSKVVVARPAAELQARPALAPPRVSVTAVARVLPPNDTAVARVLPPHGTALARVPLPHDTAAKDRPALFSADTLDGWMRPESLQRNGLLVERPFGGKWD